MQWRLVCAVSASVHTRDVIDCESCDWTLFNKQILQLHPR